VSKIFSYTTTNDLSVTQYNLILIPLSMLGPLSFLQSPISLSFPFIPPIISIMSTTFYVTGFFPLGNGHQERYIPSSGSRPTTFIVYDSAFKCPDGTRAAVSIWTFSPSMTVLPNYTVAWIFAKAVIPQATSESIHFHATYFYPVVGDPSAPSYDASIPGLDYPVFVAIGHVIAVDPITDPNAIQGFNMSTSSYVNGKSIPSHVRGLFVNKRRWSTIPNLIRNSSIAIIGSARSISSVSGYQLSIALDDVTLNLASSTALATPAPASPAGNRSSSRRFDPFIATLSNVAASSSFLASASSSSNSSMIAPPLVPADAHLAVSTTDDTPGSTVDSINLNNGSDTVQRPKSQPPAHQLNTTTKPRVTITFPHPALNIEKPICLVDDASLPAVNRQGRRAPSVVRLQHRSLRLEL
jgi:hypothetical protein